MGSKCKGTIVWMLLGFVLCLHPEPSLALEPTISVHGRMRIRQVMLSDYALGADDFHHGHKNSSWALVRVYPRLQLSKLAFIKADLQAVDGQFMGDESIVGAPEVIRPWERQPIEDQAMVREAYAQIPVGIGVLRVGRMASHWGLGLIANNGDTEQYLFSDATHGDISNRLMFVTQPLAMAIDGPEGKALNVVLAADLVERDELANRSEGDRALQYLGAILWKKKQYQVGIYVAYRDMEDHNGYATTALASDLYANYNTTLGTNWHLRVALEAVFITGSTEMARFEAADYPVALSQFGWVLKTWLSQTKMNLVLGLETGMASGDNHTSDSTAKAFKFDPGYKVGMILFEDVLNRITARTYDQVRNPNLMGTPPQGHHLIPTNGSVTNAIYVNPTVTLAPIQSLDLSLGFLAAWAPADVVDAYASALNGGYNTNSFGKSNASGMLGMEGNLGAKYELPISPDVMTLSVGAQYGVFLPGPALKAATDGPSLGMIHKARLLADIRW